MHCPSREPEGRVVEVSIDQGTEFGAAVSQPYTERQSMIMLMLSISRVKKHGPPPKLFMLKASINIVKSVLA
jgi:hypothetical protein